jgi:hypothetical protein
MVLDGETVTFNEDDLRVLGCGEDPGVVTLRMAEFIVDCAHTAAGTDKSQVDSAAMAYHQDADTLAKRDGVNIMAVPGLRTGYTIWGSQQLRSLHRVQEVRAISDNLGARLS